MEQASAPNSHQDQATQPMSTARNPTTAESQRPQSEQEGPRTSAQSSQANGLKLPFKNKLTMRYSGNIGSALDVSNDGVGKSPPEGGGAPEGPEQLPLNPGPDPSDLQRRVEVDKTRDISHEYPERGFLASSTGRDVLKSHEIDLDHGPKKHRSSKQTSKKGKTNGTVDITESTFGQANDIDATDSSSHAGLRKFACPYFKRKSTNRPMSCGYPGFTSIARLKEHLYRQHMLPPNQCRRCLRVFRTDADLDEHMRQPTPCPVEGSTGEGITAAQEKRLKSKKRSKTSEEEKWREIWRILFSDEEMPTPYCDVMLLDMTELEAFCRRGLHSIVSAKLLEARSLPIRENSAWVEEVLEIVRASLDEVFSKYRQDDLSIPDHVAGWSSEHSARSPPDTSGTAVAPEELRRKRSIHLPTFVGLGGALSPLENSNSMDIESGRNGFPHFNTQIHSPGRIEEEQASAFARDGRYQPHCPTSDRTDEDSVRFKKPRNH